MKPKRRKPVLRVWVNIYANGAFPHNTQHMAKYSAGRDALHVAVPFVEEKRKVKP